MESARVLMLGGEYPKLVELAAAMTVGADLNDQHGVGLRLAPFMPIQYGAGMDMLWRIKHALDPNDILCPDKLWF